MERREARRSAVNLGVVVVVVVRGWRHLFSMTRSAPCTPLPRRLGAYSDRSTWRSHSITLARVCKYTSFRG